VKRAVTVVLAIAAILPGSGGHAGPTKPFGPTTYSVATAVRAHGVIPSRQFGFLVGQWRVEQLLPQPTQEQRAVVLREDWSALPDGSLVGRSYTQGRTDPHSIIEIRLLIERDSYYHTLQGPGFTGGQLLKMPVVQVGRASFASVNWNGHAPVRTNYDLLADGSISASIYLEGDSQVSVYHMLPYAEGH
jgi:hypothetical protein